MEEELDLDAGWSIGEDAFNWIVSRLANRPLESIVEFGSGVSSVRLAQVFPDARILSIEHDEAQHQRSVLLRDKYMREGELEISLRPLTWQRHYGAWYRSYQLGPFPTRVDAVIVDGPPWYSYRGREACLYQIAPSLTVGGLLVLDDYSRREERASAGNWDSVFRGQFSTQIVDVGHGLCVKERAQGGRGAIVLGVLLENYRLLARRALNRALRVLERRRLR